MVMFWFGVGVPIMDNLGGLERDSQFGRLIALSIPRVFDSNLVSLETWALLDFQGPTPSLVDAPDRIPFGQEQS